MKIGLVGCGKMGSALLQGIVAAGLCSASDVTVSDAHAPAAEALEKALPGLAVAGSLAEIGAADVVLICVKPGDVAPVLNELGRGENRPLFISIAAGITLSALERAVGEGHRVVRVMPNTPALIGKGASAYALGSNATADDAALTEKLLGAVGTVNRVPEKLLDAVTGLSRSGPAYVYTIVEALAEGGLLMGLPVETAITLAAQTVAGAAEMVLKTKLPPSVLKHQVTSPGGTTIAGLRELEKNGLRFALIEAVRAATQRAADLGK